MTNLIQNEPDFSVIGITIRTTNKAAVEAESILKLWQQFFEKDILSKIPNKIDDAVIALYFDYDSDKNGEYTLLLGARVASIDKIPFGMIAKQIPARKTETFITNQGELSLIVLDLWKRIWTLEDQGELNRSYDFDYELYDERCYNPAKATMAIHISVK